jgi:hypothetical protein
VIRRPRRRLEIFDARLQRADFVAAP